MGRLDSGPRRLASLPWLLALLAGIARAAPPAPPAPPAPLATLSDDVDGDGAPDAIELGADGVVHIAGKPRGDVKLATAITRGRLAVTHYRGQHYVVARITTPTAPVGAPAPGSPAAPGPAPAVPDGTEAVILRADGGVWHEVLRFPIGGVGLDHDYGIDVDAAPDGIYRYQTRETTFGLVHLSDGSVDSIQVRYGNPATWRYPAPGDYVVTLVTANWNNCRIR